MAVRKKNKHSHERMIYVSRDGMEVRVCKDRLQVHVAEGVSDDELRQFIAKQTGADWLEPFWDDFGPAPERYRMTPSITECDSPPSEHTADCCITKSADGSLTVLIEDEC